VLGLILVFVLAASPVIAGPPTATGWLHGEGPSAAPDPLHSAPPASRAIPLAAPITLGTRFTPVSGPNAGRDDPTTLLSQDYLSTAILLVVLAPILGLGLFAVSRRDGVHGQDDIYPAKGLY